jgi:serine/threonine-protein kinase
VLSRGRQLVEVPDIRGQALQAAQVNVAASGLQVGRLTQVYTSSGEPGTVVRQGPAPGSQVDRAVPVHMFVALENTSEIFVMPDLVYRGYEQVRQFFESRAFRIGSVKFEPYEGAQGIVLRQYPLPGHPLRRRDVISLVVAAEADGT